MSAGRWRLVLAVSTNANAITQLAELAEIARSIPSGEELEGRLAQPGRINASVRDRYDQSRDLSSKPLRDCVTEGLRDIRLRRGTHMAVLSSLTVRTLRLERTDRIDRTTAVNALQRVLRREHRPLRRALLAHRGARRHMGTAGSGVDPVGDTAEPERLPLSSSPRFASAWSVIDRLGLAPSRLNQALIGRGSETLELERPTERSRVEPP